VVGAGGIPIYPGGERLCLSACPVDGEVKKNCRTPLRITSGTALKNCSICFYSVHKLGNIRKAS